jgi:SRSO17 transposase
MQTELKAAFKRTWMFDIHRYVVGYARVKVTAYRYAHSNMLKISRCSMYPYARLNATSNMYAAHAVHASIMRVATLTVK